MGIWVHPYTVKPVLVGVDFRIIGVGLSLSDVAMSWLRLQTPVDCIPHPYHMYTRFFIALICCGWAYGCTLTLLHLCNFRKIGVGLSLCDVAMSWLRLQTPVDCIPHPYHIYGKCFSTFICCLWAYGSTLMLIHWGWILGKLGVWPSPSDVVRS